MADYGYWEVVKQYQLHHTIQITTEPTIFGLIAEVFRRVFLWVFRLISLNMTCK